MSSINMLSRHKKGPWSINDVYGRLNFKCWGYEAASSGLYGLYVWGHNPHGEFGYGRSGAPGSSHVPVLVGAVDCWSGTMTIDDMVGCYWLMSTKTDGTAWAWGLNNHGMLGNGSYSPASSPSQISGCWRCVSAGWYHGTGVKCDGTLWTWGVNPHGQLGLNCDGGSVATPQQVGSGTDWCAVHAGHHQTYAVKCNGNLFSWGHNAHGEMGDGTTTPRSSPVQIPGTWCCARGGSRGVFGRRSDGSHFAWGNNPYGNLGTSNTTNYCSPVLLPGSWTHVSKTSSGHWQTAGIKNDNTLWVWGHLPAGEPGNCTTCGTMSSPLQVAGTWCWAGAGYNEIFGVKCDGTLWGWGQNPHSEIDITATPRSSPQQILGNTWRDVAAGHWFVVARTDGISQKQEGICFETYPSVCYPSYGVCCYN